MKNKKFTKVLSVILCAMMLIGILPVSAFAVNYEEAADDYYKLISKDDYTLAPGIYESQIVLNNAAGTHRQVAHVVEIDINNPYTKVMPSYKGMAEGLADKKYGVEIMSKQAQYAEEHGYGNVVAAMNLSLSWYDSTYYKNHPELVGEPLGYMIMDGVQYTNSQGKTNGAQTCLVINFDEKDGVARPDSIPKTEIRATSSAITGWEEQVIPANFGFLVKDGKNQYKTDNNAANGASRSFVGLKADGSIVMVMNDGRQAPYSTGFTNYEMAEFMIALGCVQAVNGDGGGSSAFLSQRPGEELKINCSPSDGAERDTTHGILVISTAPATGEFVQAHLSSEEDYYTPGSTVQFTAIGTDLVGTPADIPANAVWQLADESFGIIQDGLFVSNGKMGDVTVQMTVDGAVVGEDTIHIVMPDTLSFALANMTVPFGKTVNVGLSATYDNKNVVLKASDVTFTLSDGNIGTVNGFDFTAGEEGIAATESLLTAVVGEVSTTTNLSLGKGSEIIYDFENQNLDGWSIFTNYGKYGPVGPNGKVTDANGNYWYHGQNERGYISIADKITGKVKNGDYALAVECDFTQIYETGYHALNLFFPTIDCTDTVAIGFWLYIPYDARHAQLGIGSGGFDNGELFLLNEGWHYVTAQASNNQFRYINISIDDRACASTGNYYNYIEEPNVNGKYTFYIDDITLDYSTAVDDREAPIFTAPTIMNPVNETSSVMNGQTINYNTVSFEATVKENMEKTNAVGINDSTAKAYIDGREVDFTYSNGKFSITSVNLADGLHTVKFYIADKMGNESWIEGSVVIQSGVDASTVKVVPQDPTADRILIGSLYWLDVVATDIETIEKVELVFDMNNASSWELEGLTVADGFTATYGIQADDNIATIIIERTGANNATGEAVLASFPVRTWVSTITEYEGYEDQTPATLVKRGIIWAQSIELALEKGVITYVAEYATDVLGCFGMEDILVDTELFFTNYSRKSVAGAQDWINACVAAGVGFHEHTVEAVADKAATCTKAGYTGRTYCEVCDSIVDWGTVVPATGHSFEVTEDGVYACDKGDAIYYYVNGEPQNIWYEAADGVYYYNVYGTVINGAFTVDGHTYKFEHNKLVDGAFEKIAEGHTILWWAGKKVENTWFTIGDKTYYFITDVMAIGIQKVAYRDENGQRDGYRYYAFAEDGVWMEDYEGFYAYGADACWVENGVAVYKGLCQDSEGNYYYMNSRYLAVKNCSYSISEAKANGLLPAGKYQFGADGKMINVPTEEPDTEAPDTPVEPEPVKNGLVIDADGEIRYYVDGVATYAGLVQDAEGNYYYINSGKKAVKNSTYGISEARANGLLPAGTYEFGADGKMINVPTEEPDVPVDPDTPVEPEPVKNGLVIDADGEIRYYVDGVATYAGLVQDAEGNYYYINSGKKAVKNCTYGISEARANGLLPAGKYQFGADGKMILA